MSKFPLLRTKAPKSNRSAAERAARILRPAVLALLVVAFGIPGFGAAAAGQDKTPVVLQITNDSGRALRCQLVLAHFMTRDLKLAAPGDGIAVDLLRETETGTLLRSDVDGRWVPVENVLCGVDADWVATRNDLDLTDLREGGARRLRIDCSARNGLSCMAAQAAD